jgi:hypothetical protein
MQSTKDSGALDMLAVKEHFTMPMGTNIVENGITINVTDMEPIRTKITLATRDIGKMICSMDRAKKHGQKDQDMKESM